MSTATATEMNPPLSVDSCSPARQRKLWEVRGSAQCSIIGTCLPLAQIRKIANKFLRGLPRSSSDYEIHSSMVYQAQTKNPVSEALHRALNRRHAVSVRRFSLAHSEDAVRKLWRQALAEGHASGPYWAVMTHPLAGEAACREAFADVHMLSHVVGSSHRAALAQMGSMKEQLAALHRALKESQATFASRLVEYQSRIHEQEERLARMRELETELHDMKERLASFENGSRIACLEREVAGHRQQLAATLRRAVHAEGELAALQAQDGRMAELERALADREAERAHVEAQLQAVLTRGESASREGCQTQNCPDPYLCGKRILYVGGRQSLVCRYRELVERLGGELVHHDGGAEDRVGRLAPVVAGVDAVLCPIDCVSHEACLQAKQMCKNYLKPFVPLRSAGLSALSRALGELSKGTNVEERIAS